ncbi:hypothetical protein SADUNF_Sadunf01G0011900 [Salix dunnii]|uniref:Lipoxygenase domain-containing protein n=1 Tax=Salix dunnii TaxID=1413687 RepID=A0A835TIM5_9ROSI|nr:hypothetical protein SADUNF_Sadunf01G0011900 [Salix dunnii]
MTCNLFVFVHQKHWGGQKGASNDGLVLWDIIKEWVSDYVNHYYSDPSLIVSDNELQAWWTEVRMEGHVDKKDEPWWPVLRTPQDLVEILTTIIWIASGHHAAVNFGQYTYAGYFPNRPTTARMNMPTEDPNDELLKLFWEKPEVILLTTYPSQIQATTVMAILDVLSNHSPDEEYLGQQIEPAWTEEPVINAAFVKFNGRLKEFEGIIDQRNTDMKLKNRNGAGTVPYELLKPFSDPGVTGKGLGFLIVVTFMVVEGGRTQELGKVKKMGELQLAVRFTCSSLVNMLHMYSHPLLSKMHYIQPLSAM